MTGSAVKCFSMNGVDVALAIKKMILRKGRESEGGGEPQACSGRRLADFCVKL